MRPRDITFGDDLTLADVQHDVFEERAEELPDLVVLEPPCGPWSSWVAVRGDPNIIDWLRALHLPLWIFTTKVWEMQCSDQALCLTEQPWASLVRELQCMLWRRQLAVG